ncbi:hypothetical protein HG536_0H00590 [Torulaspora globosa]|uniref:RNA polymerase II subunit A C-terminal domain phosphatase n=1 Tax=Torulaspora globosa TaxID=48254 RepID=A0A7G3ZME8_9SACH|nr:uncharacterized protein HG536_0H00590 [Torulaspora globosa]QLL34684.1 hypothetical protein HG536_0H00590 [Torulaspora globosa]
MTTPVFSPEVLPYPITIDQLIAPIGSDVEKGQRLFAFKFWYMVEIASSPDESEDGHGKKRVRESIEFFEAPFEGKLMSWNVDVGDEIASPNQAICEIFRPCNHDIVYGGLCTLCGKEVDESEQMGANLAISHTDVNLRVSRKEAADIEKSLKVRLRESKKLVLVVDLDQTVIHCGVDPTIGEWKRDASNPNYETLKDVRSFALEEETILPLLYMGPKPPARKCWYYVKVRPGLREFFERVAPLYEMHIYTMATRAYALEIAKIIDPDGSLFGDRILSRDENGSITQKSLERLFPTDQSMVVVIDDRGDVWNWCPNLIKVIPYNFFVGVGDINSNFLPRQQNTMLQLGRGSRKKTQESDELITDIMDTEKKLQEKIDEEVKRQEEKLSHQIATGEETAAPESKEQLARKIEYSASLEVQQQNRPLATLQKHMHNQRLLVDDDDELFYLKETLAKVHDEYYRALEEKSEQDADMKVLMPTMKSRVFENCHFVFSGLIPLGTNISRADIVLWTDMFGAQSSAEIDENTTHLITRTSGTYKARIAKAFNDKIKVVHPDWVFECLVLWKRVDEQPYELIIEQSATEEELEEYKRNLEKRSNALAESKRDAVIESTKDGPVDLFSAGTSWLNDDEEEEIPESSESSDEEVEENDSQDEEEKADKSSTEDQHPKTATKFESFDQSAKRSLGDTAGSFDNAGDIKRAHLEEPKAEDSDSELEEELLNALDE